MTRRLPRAVLHCFGGAERARGSVRRHDAPEDSRAAFPQHAIAAVPVRAGSGIRMRILEAWARGLPVVATPVAARGLAVSDGCELMLADSPARFADAIARIHGDAALRARLVAAGVAYLRAHHDARHQTRALLDVYDAARGSP
ncbi:MAG TPA: glycosyltransferase [Dokdonella sp.]|nr:glycosyltransferase [Dokdonella sp.]